MSLTWEEVDFTLFEIQATPSIWIHCINDNFRKTTNNTIYFWYMNNITYMLYLSVPQFYLVLTNCLFTLFFTFTSLDNCNRCFSLHELIVHCHQRPKGPEHVEFVEFSLLLFLSFVAWTRSQLHLVHLIKKLWQIRPGPQKVSDLETEKVFNEAL